MVYLYSVTEPRLAPPTEAGLEGAPLRVVCTDEVAAVVSDRDEPQVTVSEEALWAHERVAESLLEDGAVLPMRFGSVLPDDDAVASLLTERRDEFTAGLQRVRGAVELGVRVAWELEEVALADDQVAQGPGAAYLRGLSQSRRRARELAERVNGAVAGLFRAHVHRLLTSPSLPVTGAYLVDREAVGPFRARIAALDGELEGAGIVCTGPWPPYSFTAEGQGS